MKVFGDDKTTAIDAKRTFCSQTCGERSAGHPDEVVVGGTRHGPQLKEVAGHGEAQDAAHGDGGSQFGVRAPDTCGQVTDPLVEMVPDGFGGLRRVDRTRARISGGNAAARTLRTSVRWSAASSGSPTWSWMAAVNSADLDP
jgi:hypothetical protein